MVAMPEVQIRIEPDGREGVVAVGSYLIDAVKRFGLRFEDRCRQDEGLHFCSLFVTGGGDHLSPVTLVETEHFSAHGRKSNERLACQAKIETPGDIIIMVTEKKEKDPKEPAAEGQSEQYKKDFSELPLEKKISELVQLEAIAIGETVSFIMNSPYLIFDKVMDVMAEFGLKKEEESKKAARPKEHEPAESKPKSKSARPKKKSAPRAEHPGPTE
jgi:ferredoxin